LDQGVRFRSETSAHEKLLNVPEPAELPVEQILAITRPEQTSRNRDLPGPGLLLIEFPAANLQYDSGGGGNTCRRSLDHVDRENRFVVWERDGDRIDLRARDFDFFYNSRLVLFRQTLHFICGFSANLSFIPVVGGHVVLQIELGWVVLVGAFVDLGID